MPLTHGGLFQKWELCNWPVMEETAIDVDARKLTNLQTLRQRVDRLHPPPPQTHCLKLPAGRLLRDSSEMDRRATHQQGDDSRRVEVACGHVQWGVAVLVSCIYARPILKEKLRALSAADGGREVEGTADGATQAAQLAVSRKWK